MRDLVWIAYLVLVASAGAVEVTVSSIAQLQVAINAGKAGDVVTLADGSYTDNAIAITTSNITVRAATPGGVYLNGVNAITIPANNVVFGGFQFTSGSIPGFLVDVRGSNNTLTQLNFNGYSAQEYVVFRSGSQHNTVTFSNFQNKPETAPQGNLIEVEADPNVIGYHVISHNSCQHVPGRGGDNGNECIRLGEGAQSTYISRTVVEYNYFEDTGPGDSEAISVKSRENTLRWNTMNRNPDAMFVFRNGDNNLAYGNFFIDSGGIRIKEANNIYCYNNYFERAGVGGSRNAVTYDYVAPNLQNINFLHNTFVESGVIALATGAANNTWANNIFKKSSGAIFVGPFSGISWVGNLYSGSLGIPVPPGMTASADLGLALNAYGYYGLSPRSVAIDTSGPFPAILDIAGVASDYTLALDVAGQSRDAARDAGCVEYGAMGTVTNRPLTLADAGPSSLKSPPRTFNAAGYQEGTVALDSIVSLFGGGLALRTESYDGSAVTTLGGTSVGVTDSQGASRPAQLLFASAGQINFLLPPGTATGPATVRVTRTGDPAPQSANVTATVSAPGIFTVSGTSSVAAAVYLRVTAANLRITGYVFDAATLNAIDIPRAAGDQIYLLLYGTGFRHASQVTAAANGQGVPVLGAVAQSQYAGLDQVNIGPLPSGLPGGVLTIRLTADGSTANSIAVRLQ